MNEWVNKRVDRWSCRTSAILWGLTSLPQKPSTSRKPMFTRDSGSSGQSWAAAQGPSRSASSPAPELPSAVPAPAFRSAPSCRSEPLTGLRVTCLSQGPFPSLLPLPLPAQSSGSCCPSVPSDTHSDARRAPKAASRDDVPSLLSDVEASSNLGNRQYTITWPVDVEFESDSPSYALSSPKCR